LNSIREFPSLAINDKAIEIAETCSRKAFFRETPLKMLYMWQLLPFTAWIFC